MNINSLIEKLDKKVARKYCSVSDTTLCPNDHCTCRLAAENRAYMMSIIPDPYYKYNVSNFNGRDEDGKIIMDQKSLEIAKHAYVQYCWGNISLEQFDKMTSSERDQASKMNVRLEAGKNIVISSSAKTKGKGRTFVASLIMKEAIKRRVNPDSSMHSYGWLPYSLLCHKLVNNTDDLSAVKDTTWLVIDDITESSIGSKNQKAFMASILDPFFCQREKDKLVTILVFRHDVLSKKEYIEEEMGVTISKMINSRGTHVISL